MPRSLERLEERFTDQRHGALDLLSVDDQRRQQAQGSGLGDVDDQATLEQIGADRGCVELRLKTDTEHQPATTDLAHAAQSAQTLAEDGAVFAHGAQQHRIIDDLKHGEGCRGDQRSTAEGRP